MSEAEVEKVGRWLSDQIFLRDLQVKVLSEILTPVLVACREALKESNKTMDEEWKATLWKETKEYKRVCAALAKLQEILG